MRLRRSRLYVPGNNPKMIPTATLYGADVISLDLEDAVAPDFKIDARILVSQALKEVEFDEGVEISVRINHLSTPWGRDDIREVVCERIDCIYLPKTETPEDVLQAEELITRTEEEKGLEVGRIKLFATMETAKGILNAYDIARSCRRLKGITIGGEDLTADLGGERTPEGTAINTARSLIVLAAKAVGLQAIDTVFSDIKDEEGLRRETEMIKRMGFDGKACIHPSQIPVIHDVFNPSEEDMIWALRVKKAMKEAEERGSGVISLGKKMVDRPIMIEAERILKRAEAAELLIPDLEEVG